MNNHKKCKFSYKISTNPEQIMKIYLHMLQLNFQKFNCATEESIIKMANRENGWPVETV